jgi:PASTA domain-containing protein
VRLRRAYWRRLLGSSFVVVVAAAGSALPASGSSGDVAYRGTRIDVSRSAVVDVRTLARLDRLRKRAAGPSRIAQAQAPEAQERAEPNVRLTVPSPFPAPLSLSTFTQPVQSPYVSAGFLAQADAPPVGGTRLKSPPDTNGAVGRDKLMVPLNSNYVIQRKSEGAVLSTVSMDTFWTAVGAHDPFDPRVLYDPYHDRWLASAASDPLLPSSLVLYGISDTADPQGSWHLYALDADPSGGTFADFPTLGFSSTTVAIGLNMFATGTRNYVRGRLIVLDYGSLRTGGDGHPVDIDIPDGFVLQPAVTYSPTESTLYLVEHFASESGTYRFWFLNGTTLTLVGGAPETNPLGPWATPGPGNLLPQQDGRGIDSGDARIGNAVFRNGDVYYTQTIGFPPGPLAGAITRTAIQWVELDTAGGFVQGGRIDDPRALPWNGGHLYAFASIAVNARNDVLVGFSDFESDDFADAAYAYRAGTDPPNTLRAPVTLKDGEGPYAEFLGSALNRWGDYSGTQVDPSDDLSLWTVQEYARIPSGRGDNSGRWGTWWGRIGGGPPLTPPHCVVPKLVGKPLGKAWRRIVAAHCRIGKVRQVLSAKKRRGRVVRQKPAPGQRLASDSRVDLAIGA